MTEIICFIYLLIPFFYILLISTTKRNENTIVNFNLRGGLIILLFYLFTLIFVESNDKPNYLEAYLDPNYYETYNRELLWGKLQIFLSSLLMKNETLYWLFYSFFYCVAYFFVAKKFFPFQYAGYFVLCAVGCMGFVSYGSNTIRAGFGLALLMMAFCANNWWVKTGLSIAAIGCNMPMLIPVTGYLFANYIMKKERWCEGVWLIFLLITSLTSVVSDILMLAGGLDARTTEWLEGDGSDVYNIGFRADFLIYSLIPILYARYNMKHLITDVPLYCRVYRTYILVNALWLLLMRIPYTDRFAYLSWFMIPFLLLYPVLNCNLDCQHPQRYIFRAIGLFIIFNAVLTLKTFL